MRKIVPLLVIGILGAISLTGCASSETSSVGPCHVSNTTATSKSKGGIKYLVYTDECGVLTVDDAPLKNAWNSSDTFAKIKKGKTYQFELYGFRNGFLSSYPNILDVKEL